MSQKRRRHDYLGTMICRDDGSMPRRGSNAGSKVTEPTSKGSRLRALNRLLEYALTEAEALGLLHLDKLLGAAALAVSDELDNVEVLSPKMDASRKRRPPKP
jgi:hypothetical protein